MVDENSQAEAEGGQIDRPIWAAPVVTIASIHENTGHAANTVSDGTGNLYS